MKNTTIYVRALLVLAVPCLILGANAAHADDSSWYGGAGFGSVAADHKTADFNDGSISTARIDDTDTAWKLFGGYQFNRYFSVEGGYTDLHNDTDKKTTFSGVSDGSGSRFTSFPDGPVSVDIDDITGLFAAAVVTYPFVDRLSLNGKVGVVRWEAKQTTRDLGQQVLSLDGTDALIGVGAEYRFGRGIAIRGEAERYFGVGDTDQDVFALSLLYRF